MAGEGQPARVYKPVESLFFSILQVVAETAVWCCAKRGSSQTDAGHTDAGHAARERAGEHRELCQRWVETIKAVLKAVPACDTLTCS